VKSTQKITKAMQMVAAAKLKRLHGDKIIDFVDLSGYKTIDASAAALIGDKVRTLFEEGGFDVCTLFYSKFKSVISQAPTAQQLIPATPPEGAVAPDLRGAMYTYEPNEAAILEGLLPRYVDGQIFRALLENAAGEQGARMSAMDNATRNAGDMIKKLSLRYNRQRQANITKELIEIISGAEAL
jgi:F-type H+-transporting ATPase subunit gamma